MKNIAIGDIVVVEAPVTKILEGKGVNIRYADGTYSFVSFRDIKAVKPKPIAVGDKVFADSFVPAIVIAIDNGKAWIKVDNNRDNGIKDHAVVDITRLTRFC